MADFNRNNRGGGGRDFGRRFGGDRGGDRQMFKTTCSNCGKECEVPFKPTGSKPVYCNACFRTMGGSDSRRSEDRDSRKPNFDNRSDNRGRNSEQPQYREQFEALNSKLDKILAMLSYASSTKTVKMQKTEVAVEAEAPKIVEMPELPKVPEEEKMVQDLQLQPEEPTIIPKKTRAPRKTTLLPITE